jgi:hypothetical protein
MGKFGFKEISKENWLQPNDAMAIFATLAPNGEIATITGEDWLDRMLQPKLNDNVPEEVQALFEVARGTLIYGFLFYPLYTLGTEQLMRVGEAAITHRCNQLGAPSGADRFARKLQWLKKRSVIAGDDAFLWGVTCDLRNTSSHARSQSILMPHDAYIFCHSVAQIINHLFAGS